MKTAACLFAIAAAPAAGSKLRLTQGGASTLLQFTGSATGVHDLAIGDSNTCTRVDGMSGCLSDEVSDIKLRLNAIEAR
jgi:hypothetical protein